jgi:hypothetical protein
MRYEETELSYYEHAHEQIGNANCMGFLLISLLKGHCEKVIVSAAVNVG